MRDDRGPGLIIRVHLAERIDRWLYRRAAVAEMRVRHHAGCGIERSSLVVFRRIARRAKRVNNTFGPCWTPSRMGGETYFVVEWNDG